MFLLCIPKIIFYGNHLRVLPDITGIYRLIHTNRFSEQNQMGEQPPVEKVLYRNMRCHIGCVSKGTPVLEHFFYRITGLLHDDVVLRVFARASFAEKRFIEMTER